MAISLAISLACAVLAFFGFIGNTLCDIDGCSEPSDVHRLFGLGLAALAASVVLAFLRQNGRRWMVAVAVAALAAAAFVALAVTSTNHLYPG